LNNAYREAQIAKLPVNVSKLIGEVLDFSMQFGQKVEDIQNKQERSFFRSFKGFLSEKLEDLAIQREKYNIKMADLRHRDDYESLHKAWE